MPPSLVTRFNARIRNFLEVHNLRQKDLARALGLKHPGASELLSGQRTQSWHLDRLWAMARYHAQITGYNEKITLEWFFRELEL